MTTPPVTDADDETQDDDSTEGEEGMPADDGNAQPDQSITIGPELIASSGLDPASIKPGDTLTFTVKLTVGDFTDGTLTGNVEDVTDGAKAMGDSSMPPTKKKPQSRVVGPVEAGFQDEAGTPVM